MTIEALLERIAVALEQRNAASLIPAEVQIAETKSYAEQRKEEVRKEAGGERPRGPQALPKTVLKGPKEKEPAKAPEPKKEEPTDDFLETPAAEPPKAVTIDEVRAALVKFRADKTKELGAEKAKELAVNLLAKHGNGASVLIGSAAAKMPDGSDHPGLLKPEFYAAVLKAIQA